MKTVIYVNPRDCHGLKIPLRTQTKQAKDFCSENKLEFSLPTTENWYGTDLKILDSIFKEKDFKIITFSELFFCSNEAYKILFPKNEILIYTTYENKKYNLIEIITYIESFMRSYKFKSRFKNVKDKIPLLLTNLS